MTTKAKGGKWINRTLLYSPYYMGLCKTQKAFEQELRKMKVPLKAWPEFVPPNCRAQVHFFESPTPLSRCAIVCVSPLHARGRSKVSIYSTLVHESVHIWQWVKEALGEHYPSKEFEAYSIQSISLGLMEAWDK